MSALSAATTAPYKEVWDKIKLPVKGGSTCYQGGLACTDSSDSTITPGAVATTLRAIGVFCETVDNSAGADGAKLVDVELFYPRRMVWLNNANLVATDLFKVCYIADDQGVTATSTGASVAGIAWKLETIDGVAKVLVEPPYPAIAG